MEEDILAVLGQRAPLYSCIRAQAAYAKEKDVWKHVFTLFTALHRSDRQPENSRLDYGNLLIANEALNLDEFRGVIHALATDKKLRIPRLPEIRMEGSFEQRQGQQKYLSSNSAGIGFPWPADFYLYNPASGCQAHPPGDTLFSREQPLFPDGITAIESLFQVPLRGKTWENGGILVLLPNYKGKLLSFKIGKERITVEILAQEIDPTGVQGKIYIRTEKESVTKDFVFTNSKAVVPIASRPLSVLLYIFSAEGDVLDYRYLSLMWPGKEIAAYVESSPEDMRQAILQGESETVEFKREVKGENRTIEEFVESVVAFANYKGGTIFVGVDDKCNIVGVGDTDRIQQAIESWARDRCEPMVRLSTRVVRIDDASMVLVEVPEGDNKPYFVRDRGPYIRAGSSDRIMTRYEFDEIYTAKRSSRFQF